MSDITYLTLPTWTVGSLNIRLIYLVNKTTFRLSESPNKDSAVPLYLGADLLSNTDIRTENHPRCHAKFAKKGLATKLHFPSVYRFHGIRLPSSNNSLWFYSVQGLFRIAFEMFNKHDQLSVLERFQDIWKSHLDDDPLQMGYDLSEQSDSASIDPGPRTETPESFKESQTPQDTRGDSTDHDYCSSENPAEEEEEESGAAASLRHKVQRLSDGLPQIRPEQLRTVHVLLDFIDRFARGDVTDAAAAEAVMALLHAKRRDGDGVYSSSLLGGVGRWLGRQFHEANGSISQKVEGFKEQHIERISDLPPPEELSRQLFPDAMLGLLLHWMGLSEDWSAAKRNSEYPILLLILEFANHNLITGVAHVLYSSLICK